MMNEFKWQHDNLSITNQRLISYNTLYFDKLKSSASGLILFHKGKTIGFMGLTAVGGLLNKIYISKTGLLLTNTSFYIEALIALEEFVISNGISIISQVDFAYKKTGYLNKDKVSIFTGSKQTIINSIDKNAETWLLEIKKKHRYYVRRALRVNNQSCTVKIAEDLTLSFVGKLYDVYASGMRKKNVELLFSSKSEFETFIKRNAKNIIVTICYMDNKITYMNVVHTNGKIANYIMAVTTSSGMSSYASYMGVYELYDYLYNNNFKILNFGGVDVVNNHGVYLFKRGFAGELLESSSHMVVGKGLAAWVARKILQLRMLIKLR